MTYVACAEPDGEIYNYASGDTPQEAFDNFMGQEFFDHCNNCELDDGDSVEVCVFEQLLVADLSEEEIDAEGLDPDWKFYTGDEVMRKTMQAITCSD